MTSIYEIAILNMPQAMLVFTLACYAAYRASADFVLFVAMQTCPHCVHFEPIEITEVYGPQEMSVLAHMIFSVAFIITMPIFMFVGGKLLSTF